MHKSAKVGLQTEGQGGGVALDALVATQEKLKLYFLYGLSFALLLAALIFNSPQEILEGLMKIYVHPSTLVADYMKIGNIGAALFNSGLMALMSVVLVDRCRGKIGGITIAAVFTVAGFSLFGKNLYNSFSLVAGVFAYSQYKKENFSKYLSIALFSTGIAPIVSQVTFGYGFTPLKGILLANTIGFLAGFLVSPLAAHVPKFHQGFNLYNIGFTIGLIATAIMALFRSFGLENERANSLLEGANLEIGLLLGILFGLILVFAFIYNPKELKDFPKLLKRTGQAPSDFLENGFANTLLNMALLGFISTGYVLLVGGELNGATVGGVLTIVGFGAFGKHVKNVIPIMVGILLASTVMTVEVNSISALLAALFGTTLAPVAGKYGWVGGILAGFLHMAMVVNVGGLHGGMNLYNNGFSGGFVAGILVPILDSLQRKES